MTDLHVLEVITPNARDLQGSARPTLELPLSRALTDWERLALRGQKLGTIEIDGSRLRFTPGGPHNLATLLTAIKALPDTARRLREQHEATATETLKGVRSELADFDLLARQAHDYGEGTFGPR